MSPHNLVNFGALAAEIGPVVWGTPANFNGFRVLAALLHGTVHHASEKDPTFKLSVTLPKLNRLSKFVHWWKAHEICYKTHMTLFTLP